MARRSVEIFCTDKLMQRLRRVTFPVFLFPYVPIFLAMHCPVPGYLLLLVLLMLAITHGEISCIAMGPS